MNVMKITHRWTGEVLYTGTDATLRATVAAAIKSSANLCGADLGNAYLRGAYLRRADLGGADLRNADLRDADLCGADLCGADLRYAYLRRADLGGADLRNADLRDADLRRADLGGADLRNADLRDAKLGEYVKLVGIRPILQIGPIGSRNDYLLAYVTNTGVCVRAGCFFGSLDEFRTACKKTHSHDTPYGCEYAAAITMIEAHAAIWTPTQQPTTEAI